MPRGGRSSMGGRSRSPPNRSATYAQAPKRTYQAPPTTAPSRGGMFSGLGGALMTGMAFGAGSEVAHQAIRGITGNGSHEQQHVVQQAPPQEQQNMNKCHFENTNFISCLKTNGDSLSECQSYFNMLKECEKKY